MNIKNQKERLDLILVERGLTLSRERAQSLIMSGSVFVNSVRVDKAGQKVLIDAEIEVKGSDHPYVSRGGLKLNGALKRFNLNPTGLVGLDIGCSTGGFTDCLLQNGAKKVIAVDVGKGVMDYRLRIDPRVHLIEDLNARNICLEDIGEPVDIIVIDVAFISLALILPQIPPLLKTDGVLVPLVKPQFEVGKDEVESGGIIRSLDKHLTVLKKIRDAGIKENFFCNDAMISPIEGIKGNREYFLRFDKQSDKKGKIVDDDYLSTVVYQN
jgi:23S rRNA (cytidine1920-2'-O)/16S rRNA (cytidine1409-2'-O)-methyltransferase